MGHLVIDNKSSSTSKRSSSLLLFSADSLLPATTRLSVEPSQTPMPPHSLLTSREVVPSCAEDPLLPLDTSSPLLTANTTSHPVLQSLSEMSLFPELNPLNKCSTLFNKSHMNSTVHPTNKTTSSGGSISNSLRQVTVPVISNDDCDTYPYYRN